MRSQGGILKSCSLFLAFSYLTTQCVFAHAVEANFWKERQSALSHQNADADTRLASLPLSSLNPSIIEDGSSFNLAPVISESIPQAIRQTPFWPVLQQIPMQFGRIRQMETPRRKNTGRVVLHIQDVHLHHEAQSNIGKIIDQLGQKSAVKLVGLEGAFDPISLKTFHDYSDQRIIQKVSEYLLKTDKISGAIYGGLQSSKNNISFIGVDDKTHYNAHVQAYKNSVSQKQNLERELLKEKNRIARLKNQTFNDELKSFDRDVIAYLEGRVPFSEFVELVAKRLPSIDPELEVFISAKNMELSLNQSQVEKERSWVVEKLIQRLTPKETQALLNLSMAHKLRQTEHVDFYRALKDLCEKHRVALEQYKALNNYIQYVLLSESINPNRLLEHLTQSENRLYDSLAHTKAEQNLIQETQSIYLIQKLINFSLTSSEWKQYVELKSAKGSPAFSLTTLKSFESFYEEAQNRDIAMAQNLFSAMEKQNLATAVLVTGGFHSQGISNYLKDRGISTIEIVPRLTQVNNQETSTYLGIFSQEKTPLEKLFEGQKLFLSISPTAGISESPFLISALSHISGAAQKPTQIFNSVTPYLKLDSAEVSLSGENTATVKVTQGDKTIVDTINTDKDLNIQKSLVQVFSNTHVLSAILSWVSMLIYQESGNVLSWPFAITVFLTTEFVLFYSTIGEEVSHAIGMGENLKNIPSLISDLLPQKNLASSFVKGTALKGVHLKNTSSNPKLVRLAALAGFVFHGGLTFYGLSLVNQAGLSSPLGLIGVVLAVSNSFLFSTNLFLGTDLQALLTGKTNYFTCGVFGFHAVRRLNERYVFNPERFGEWMSTAGVLTQIRGAQSAGKMKMLIIPAKKNNSWMRGNIILAIQYFVLDFLGIIKLPNIEDLKFEGADPSEVDLENLPEEYRVAHIVAKRLNTRRGKLITRLMSVDKILFRVAELSGYKPIEEQESQTGHTRYATGSKTILKNAHPHGLKPRIAEKWTRVKENNKFVTKKIHFVLDTKLVQNGDLNGFESPVYKVNVNGKESTIPVWPLFQKYTDTGELRAWIEKVSGKKINEDGDTPVAAAIVDFFITQGMWYQSVRLAYQMAIAKSPTETPPPQNELEGLKVVFDNLFEKHRSELYDSSAQDISQLKKEAIPALLSEMVAATGGSRVFTSNWTAKQKKDFASIALEVFLYNDASQATKFLFSMVSEDSTCGLAVSSSHKPEEKVLTAHNKLPMGIGYDPTKKAYFFGSDHNAIKANLDFNKSKILYLKQEDREVATLTLSTMRIYSNRLKRDLTYEEINGNGKPGRWHSLKDSRYAVPPEISPVENPLQYDLDRVVDALLGIHKSWNPNDPKFFEPRNMKSREHLTQLLLEKDKEIEQQLAQKQKLGLELIPERPATPDILLIGIENSRYALRDFAHTLKNRFCPNLNIVCKGANQFNIDWKDPDKRKVLLGRNTIVIVQSMSGLTLMSLDATEVTKNIKGRISAIQDEMENILEGFSVDERHKIHWLANEFMNSIPNLNAKNKNINVRELDAVKQIIALIYKLKELEENSALLLTMSTIHQTQHQNGVREVFTITEGWDNEMTRANGLDLNNPEAPNNIFVIGGPKSRVEVATLSADKGIQFLTELLYSLADNFEKTKTGRFLGFTTTREQLDQFHAANERMLREGIPAIIGRLPNNKGTVISEGRNQILKGSKRMADSFFESMKIDIQWKLLVWVAVAFKLAPFTGLFPMILSPLFENFAPMWFNYGGLSINLTPLWFIVGAGLIYGVIGKSIKLLDGKPWSKKLLYPKAFMGLALLFLVPTLAPKIFFPTFEINNLIWRMVDATFFITASYAWMMIHRKTQGRDPFARIHGNRVLFISDDPGVMDPLYVSVGKLFSLAFGHFAINLRKGSLIDEALMEESHNLPRGAFGYIGGPDGRRTGLKESQFGNTMGARQLWGTVNSTLNSGPELIFVNQNPDAYRFDTNITLPSDEDEVLSHNADQNPVHLNWLVEERISRLQRLVAGQVFFANMYKEMTTRIPYLSWPAHTQNNSHVLTTASPLNPIPSEQSLHSRDIQSIATRLVQQSKSNEVKAWIPEGLGSLFDAAVYDVGGPNSGTPVELDDEDKPTISNSIVPVHEETVQVPQQKPTAPILVKKLPVHEQAQVLTPPEPLSTKITLEDHAPKKVEKKTRSRTHKTSKPFFKGRLWVWVIGFLVFSGSYLFDWNTKIFSSNHNHRAPIIKSESIVKATNFVSSINQTTNTLLVHTNNPLLSITSSVTQVIPVKTNAPKGSLALAPSAGSGRLFDEYLKENQFKAQQNLQKHIQFRYNLIGEEDPYLKFLKKIGVAHIVNADLQFPKNPRHYHELTNRDLPKLRLIKELTSEEKSALRIVTDPQDSNVVHVPLNPENPNSDVVDLSIDSVVLIEQKSETNSLILYKVEIGLEGWKLLMNPTTNPKFKETLSPQKEASTEGTTNSTSSAFIETLENVGESLPTNQQQKNWGLMVNSVLKNTPLLYQLDQFEGVHEDSNHLQGWNDLFDKKSSSSLKFAQLSFVFAYSRKSLKTSFQSLISLVNQFLSEKENHVVFFPINELKGNSEQDLKNLGEFISAEKRNTVENQAAVEVVVVIHGSASEQEKIISSMKSQYNNLPFPIHFTRVSPDMVDQSGRISYRKVFEGIENSGPLVQAILRQEEMKILVVSRNPGLYDGDKKMLALITLLVNLGLGWEMFNGNTLNQIESITKVLSQQA